MKQKKRRRRRRSTRKNKESMKKVKAKENSTTPIPCKKTEDAIYVITYLKENRCHT